MTIQDTLSGFNANNARVALTGAVRVAPVGTEIPKITEKYGEDYENLGYLSADGVELTFDEDKQEYVPWQEAAAIRTDITKATKSIKFTMWETTPDRIARFLGVPADQIQVEEGTTQFWEAGLPQFDNVQLCVDMVDGDKHTRVVFPNAKISERGSLSLKKDEIFSLEVTYDTFPAGEEYEEPALGKTAFWQFNKAYTGGAVSSATDGVAELQITTASLDAATENEEYSATLHATGGTAPYTWVIESGSLPVGLDLAANGVISGTPTTAGTETVTVKVTDSEGLPASKEFNITVS